MGNYWLDVAIRRRTAQELEQFLLGRVLNKRYVNPNDEIHRLIRLFFDLHPEVARHKYAMSVNAELLRNNGGSSLTVIGITVTAI